MILNTENRRFIELPKNGMYHIEFGQFSQEGIIFGSRDDEGYAISEKSGLFDTGQLARPERIYENQTVIIDFWDSDTIYEGIVKYNEMEGEMYVLIPHDIT